MSYGSPAPAPDWSMAVIRSRIKALGLTQFDVWLAYLAVGGRASVFELGAYLQGVLEADGLERMHIEHAVWECEQFGRP